MLLEANALLQQVGSGVRAAFGSGIRSNGVQFFQQPGDVDQNVAELVEWGLLCVFPGSRHPLRINERGALSSPHAQNILRDPSTRFANGGRLIDLLKSCGR